MSKKRRDNFDIILAKSPRNVGQYHMTVREFHLKGGVRKGFHHFAIFKLDDIIFRHLFSPYRSLFTHIGE